MNKNRTETFSDGVIAIIITILALGLKIPSGGSLKDLWSLKESFLVYVISFFLIGIIWHNHHHLFQLADRVNGKVVWMNTLLLFVLTLFPFTTQWVSEHINSTAPEIFYGITFLLSDVCFYMLNRALVKVNGPNSVIYKISHGDKKVYITLILNTVAIIAGYFYPPLVMIISFIVLIIWFIPNKLIEKNYEDEREEDKELV